jgi:hypothetical protein
MLCRKMNFERCAWRGFLIVGLLCGCALGANGAASAPDKVSQANTNRVVPSLILSGRSGADKTPARISTSIEEIIKLLDAKASPPVIKAFIQNALMAYNPTAAELIALKEHGAESDILVALLQRGAELMARTPQTQPQVQTWVLPAAESAASGPVSQTSTDTYPASGDVSTATDSYGASAGPTVIYSGLPGYPGGRRPAKQQHPPRRAEDRDRNDAGVADHGSAARPAPSGSGPARPSRPASQPGGSPSAGNSGGSPGGRPR